MNPTAPPSRARDFLVAIRVHQWIKSLVIPFVGVVMAAPNITKDEIDILVNALDQVLRTNLLETSQAFLRKYLEK